MDEQEAETASSQEKPEKEPTESPLAAEGTETSPSGDERDPQEGRSGDALAWMEGPAFRAPIEEMPTLQWPDSAADGEVVDEKQVTPEPTKAAGDSKPSRPDDDLEQAIFFLEELAKERGVPIEAMPTLVSGKGAQESFTQDLEQLGATTQPPVLDSDPMAWLEQLAIDQDSPLEELPSVANRLLASEIVSQYDAEDTGAAAGLESPFAQSAELDEALQYLEEQARAQGISLDEVSIDQVERVESSDEDLDALDKLAVAAAAAAVLKSEGEPLPEELEREAVPPDTEELGEGAALAAESEEDEWDDLSAQIPEDPDAALLWLGELAEAEESPAEDKDRSALAKGAAAVGAARLVHPGDKEADEDSDKALEAVILDGMPDDPDEAMAWMEGLAEQNEEGMTGQVTARTLAEGATPGGETPVDAVPAQKQEFVLARAALLAGDVDAAKAEYRKLLDTGQADPELIAELETAVASQPEEPELEQLLGDAYMQDGQMQKALKTYRKGFDQI